MFTVRRAALAVLVAFFAMWQAFRPGNPFDRRYAQIVSRREGLRHTALAARRGRQRLTAAGLMSEVVSRLNLLRSQRAAVVEEETQPPPQQRWAELLRPEPLWQEAL